MAVYINILRIIISTLVTGALCQIVTDKKHLSEIARENNNQTKQFLDHLLQLVDPRVRPMGKDNGPVDVRVNFHVISISAIDEINMDYKMNMFFRQLWHDPRISWESGPDYVRLASKSLDEIWIPDLYFPNEKDAKFHEVTVPNRLLKIYKDGNILYSCQLTLTLSCPMDLVSFPMDKQICAVKIESYAHETTEMTLNWEMPAIESDDEMDLPQFELREITNITCNKTYNAIGTFPCLKASFTLYRHYGFFLLQTYVPSILIIILSWVSFWINMDAVPARISLGVTTVLTMTTQLSGSKASIPKVSYPKAIDVWMSMGMFFVFCALIEYAIVNAFSRKHTKMIERRKKGDDDGTIPGDKMEISDTEPGSTAPPRGMFSSRCQHYNYRQMASNVDKVSRWLFPVCFVFFNIIYWPIYTVL